MCLGHRAWGGHRRLVEKLPPGLQPGWTTPFSSAPTGSSPPVLSRCTHQCQCCPKPTLLPRPSLPSPLPLLSWQAGSRTLDVWVCCAPGLASCRCKPWVSPQRLAVYSHCTKKESPQASGVSCKAPQPLLRFTPTPWAPRAQALPGRAAGVRWTGSGPQHP